MIRTLRAYVPPQRPTDALLKPGPDRPAWLSEILTAWAGEEVLITISTDSVNPPAWLPRATARPRSWETPTVLPPARRALPDGR